MNYLLEKNNPQCVREKYWLGRVHIISPFFEGRRRNGFGVTERGRRDIYIPAQGKHRNICSQYTTFIS